LHPSPLSGPASLTLHCSKSPAAILSADWPSL